VEQFARLILMLFVASLALALVRDGPGGATRWLKAKFLGEA
jgi:hypothetical protein